MTWAVLIAIVAALCAALEKLCSFAQAWLPEDGDTPEQRRKMGLAGRRLGALVERWVIAAANVGVRFERGINLRVERLAREREQELRTTGVFLGPLLVAVGWAGFELVTLRPSQLAERLIAGLGLSLAATFLYLLLVRSGERVAAKGWSRLKSLLDGFGQAIAMVSAFFAHLLVLTCICSVGDPLLALAALLIASPALFVVAIPSTLGISLKARRDVFYELAGRRATQPLDPRDEIVEAVYTSGLTRVSMMMTALAMLLGGAGAGHPYPVQALPLLLFFYCNALADGFIVRDTFDRLRAVVRSGSMKVATKLAALGLLKAVGAVFVVSSFVLLIYSGRDVDSFAKTLELVVQSAVGDPLQLLSQSPGWWASKTTLLPGIALAFVTILFGALALAARALRLVASRRDRNPYKILEQAFGVAWKVLAVGALLARSLES